MSRNEKRNAKKRKRNSKSPIKKLEQNASKPIFPAAEIHYSLRNAKPKVELKPEVSLFLSSAEEYLMAEILEKASNHAISRRSKSIDIQDVVEAIHADKELKELLENIIKEATEAKSEKIESPIKKKKPASKTSGKKMRFHRGMIKEPTRTRKGQSKSPSRKRKAASKPSGKKPKRVGDLIKEATGFIKGSPVKKRKRTSGKKVKRSGEKIKKIARSKSPAKRRKPASKPSGKEIKRHDDMIKEVATKGLLKSPTKEKKPTSKTSSKKVKPRKVIVRELTGEKPRKSPAKKGKPTSKSSGKKVKPRRVILRELTGKKQRKSLAKKSKPTSRSSSKKPKRSGDMIKESIRHGQRESMIEDKTAIKSSVRKIGHSISPSKPIFPAVEIHHSLAKAKPKVELKPEVSLFLSSAEEYLMAEILEKASNHAISRRSKYVEIQDVVKAINTDKELQELLGDMINKE